MWILVHENKAWQITSEDPTGLWGDTYVWVDIAENPDNIQEGWTAKCDQNGVWSFKPYSPPKPSKQEQLEANKARYEALSGSVSVALTPLLVALQLGDATEEEISLATTWQSFYRELKAVDITASNISWPTLPSIT